MSRQYAIQISSYYSRASATFRVYLPKVNEWSINNLLWNVLSDEIYKYNCIVKSFELVNNLKEIYEIEKIRQY